MSETKKKKSNGLPTHAEWNLDADDKFLRRFKRLVRSAPAHALQRMRGYLGAIVEEATCPPPSAFTAYGSNGATPSNAVVDTDTF